VYKSGLTKQEVRMAKYHTNSNEEPPAHRKVHHDHENCFEGKKIQAKHREPGDGGKPLCDECKKL
jgi:hypothetical protein